MGKKTPFMVNLKFSTDDALILLLAINTSIETCKENIKFSENRNLPCDSFKEELASLKAVHLQLKKQLQLNKQDESE